MRARRTAALLALLTPLAALAPLAPLTLTVAALTLPACGGHECTVPEGLDPDWIRELGCERDYALLWVERSDSVFSRTRTINWLVDREDGDRVYFIDSETFALHYFFATAYLDKPGFTPVGTHQEFNLLNYRRPDRRFVMGKLITYVDQGLVTVELSAGDTADADLIVFAFDRVRDSVYNGDELKYRPVSAAQESMLGDIEPRIPVIRTEEVFLGQSFQALNPAVGYGTLRFRRLDELASQPLSPTDIAVLDRVPNDIALVSGIITTEFQTPLSHINILSKNRGTPNMALRDAFDDPALRALDGALVRLEVTTQDYTVSEASPAEAQAFWDALRPSEPLIPALDLSVTALQDIAGVGAADADVVGAKAANLGEMTGLVTTGGAPIPLPEQALAIPLARYHQHLDANGLWPLIDDFLADYTAGLDPVAARERLFAIRWAIYTAPIDPALIAELSDAIRARWGEARRLRFRSSTNVEDLPGFSGAGLYTSAAASLAEGEAAIADAVRVVWASAWNEQAFVERDFYRVEHGLVRMGVLVHPAFVDEEANGVAVTINELNAARPAYYINSQIGEVSVTNPTGQAIPEQILYYTWYEEPEYEVITRSSLVGQVPGWPAGAAVLTDAELDELAAYLEAIHAHFRLVHGGATGFAMDVEFKLTPGRQIVIKQARPLARATP